MIPEDRIGQLLSAWDKDTLPGEDMRLDQRRLDYKQAEQRGDYEFCWQMLLETLWKYEASPAARRRRAETLWRDLAWPADGQIRSFHLLMRRARMAREKNHIPVTEHELQMKYSAGVRNTP